ncbi:MAG: amino acid ABC transporter permease, partial [Cyanobacteria bacterium P01_G01_bin.49]
LGISRSILANPKFIGYDGEVYLFIAAIYWLFCSFMSFTSRKLEKTLNT